MRKSLLFFLFAASTIFIFQIMVFAENDLSAPARTRRDRAAGLEASAGQGGTDNTGAAGDESTFSNSDKYRDKSFIGPKNWVGDGDIVESKDEKQNLSRGDLVYTSLGYDAVKEGAICDIYRKGSKITDPGTGKLVGYEIRYIGAIQIIGKAGINSSLARIIASNEAVLVGDELKIIEGSSETPAAN